MNKKKFYLGFGIVVFVIAIINLLEKPPFMELSNFDKFMKIGWFILAAFYFLQYRKLQKGDDEKISR